LSPIVSKILVGGKGRGDSVIVLQGTVAQEVAEPTLVAVPIDDGNAFQGKNAAGAKPEASGSRRNLTSTMTYACACGPAHATRDHEV
jgi:hypothetical protein